MSIRGGAGKHGIVPSGPSICFKNLSTIPLSLHLVSSIHRIYHCLHHFPSRFHDTPPFPALSPVSLSSLICFLKMSTFSQMFPPPPSFMEKDIPDLSTKVYIITGAASGVGLELAKILYSLHATVYIGGRSSESCAKAITAIDKDVPTSKGSLKPFVADLSDLRTIKLAVEGFKEKEYRLDVLFLNAGVMQPPAGSKTAQGYDLEMGVNCLSSFLLVSLLSPIMQNTVSHFCHPNQSIRVVWVSSLLNLGTPDGGVQLDQSGAPKQLKGMQNYMQSKAGIYLLAHEFSRRPHPFSDTPGSGKGNRVLHISLNPGFMRTELQRHAPAPMRGIMSTVFKGPKFGAYTELYAGLAPGVESGDFVIPWGRKGEVPCHILESTKVGDLKHGNTESVSERFWRWCGVQVKPFM